MPFSARAFTLLRSTLRLWLLTNLVVKALQAVRIKIFLWVALPFPCAEALRSTITHAVQFSVLPRLMSIPPLCLRPQTSACRGDTQTPYKPNCRMDPQEEQSLGTPWEPHFTRSM